MSLNSFVKTSEGNWQVELKSCILSSFVSVFRRKFYFSVLIPTFPSAASQSYDYTPRGEYSGIKWSELSGHMF